MLELQLCERALKARFNPRPVLIVIMELVFAFSRLLQDMLRANGTVNQVSDSSLFAQRQLLFTTGKNCPLRALEITILS
jgi:hypothetical protein